MRIIRAPSLLGLWLAFTCLAFTCLACLAVVAYKSAQEATHQDLSDCITELDALGGHGRTVSWESVVDVLKRHTSEFREIDGGTEAGVTYYEYEMKISGDDYWVNMGGQHRGPGIGGWLEISMVTFREGLAAKRGKVIAEVDFMD